MKYKKPQEKGRLTKHRIIGLFLHHSIKTRIKTKCRALELALKMFLHHSIKTRIKTVPTKKMSEQIFCFYIIPLKQGLRLKQCPVTHCLALFLHHSIKTRIKTEKFLELRGIPKFLHHSIKTRIKTPYRWRERC